MTSELPWAGQVLAILRVWPGKFQGRLICEGCTGTGGMGLAPNPIGGSGVSSQHPTVSSQSLPSRYLLRSHLKVAVFEWSFIILAWHWFPSVSENYSSCLCEQFTKLGLKVHSSSNFSICPTNCYTDSCTAKVQNGILKNSSCPLKQRMISHLPLCWVFAKFTMKQKYLSLFVSLWATSGCSGPVFFKGTVPFSERTV